MIEHVLVSLYPLARLFARSAFEYCHGAARHGPCGLDCRRDTITIRTSDNQLFRIRLDGIDAPERTQPYSQISRRNLIALCKDKTIFYEAVSTDRYGRTVAMVTCGGVVVNWRQVRDGLAWCFINI